jgi:hypothetical protein
MSLEEYLPYKMAREAQPIGLFGPAPFNPHSCICGRYIVDNFCLCAMSCIGTPKHTWAKENPEAYKAEQAQQARWKMLWYHWHKQWQSVNTMIHDAIFPYVQDFNMIRDAESKIGCHECEKSGNEYCTCDECDACGSKYCSGCQCDDDY